MQSTSCKNARLDEAEAGIKTAGRNINNLRHADDTTLMAESKEELKSLFKKVKEKSEKAGLDGNDNPICKTEKETQMYRKDFGTLWEKARVGCSERTALKQVYYQG